MQQKRSLRVRLMGEAPLVWRCRSQSRGYSPYERVSFREPHLAESRACSPGPLRIGLPLHMGFPKMSGGRN
jgi:hypothetical protein